MSVPFSKVPEIFLGLREFMNATGEFLRVAWHPGKLRRLLKRSLICREVSKMKADIHPEYKAVNVTCSCGNSFQTRSTLGKEDLQVEVCSQCHPFYTGKQKILDSAGQIDKFRKRFGGGKS